MHLGGLMQTSSAFGSVHRALSYLVNSYTTIADWHAVLNRLSGFTDAIESVKTAKHTEEIHRVSSSDGHFGVNSLDVFLPDGKPLLKDLHVELPSGGSLLITGPSGAGKSTLVRALAGIWPFASGTVVMPDHARVMFLPQKPYLPLGSLRHAVLYPRPPEDADRLLPDILNVCELGHLSDVLDVSNNWAHALSLGEQQRIAFARILLQQPDYVFLDEATASLDEALEAKLYQIVRSRLPHTTVVSVGHRSTLVSWHEWRLHLDGQGSWSCTRRTAN
jgi:putative ATP-binding cassette transporter